MDVLHLSTDEGNFGFLLLSKETTAVFNYFWSWLSTILNTVIASQLTNLYLVLDRQAVDNLTALSKTLLLVNYLHLHQSRAPQSTLWTFNFGNLNSFFCCPNWTYTCCHMMPTFRVHSRCNWQSIACSGNVMLDI